MRNTKRILSMLGLIMLTLTCIGQTIVLEKERMPQLEATYYSIEDQTSLFIDLDTDSIKVNVYTEVTVNNITKYYVQDLTNYTLDGCYTFYGRETREGNSHQITVCTVDSKVVYIQLRQKREISDIIREYYTVLLSFNRVKHYFVKKQHFHP